MYRHSAVTRTSFVVFVVVWYVGWPQRNQQNLNANQTENQPKHRLVAGQTAKKHNGAHAQETGSATSGCVTLADTDLGRELIGRHNAFSLLLLVSLVDYQLAGSDDARMSRKSTR
jgi:hypothetical protein